MSVEAVDLVVKGRERLLLDGLHGDLVRAAAQLREGRPALTAFFQHLPVLEMPDVGHRLLRPLILRFSLRAPSGWTVRMLYILERRRTRILAGRSRRRACPAGPSPRWPWRAPLQKARSGPSRGPWTCRPQGGRACSVAFSGEHVAQRKKIVIASFGNEYPKP